MSIPKYQNNAYSSGIPVSAGDRYYAQDLGRDFNFLRDQAGRVMKNILSSTSKIIVQNFDGLGLLSGQDKLVLGNTHGASGYAPFKVTVPNSWASLPPTTTQPDIDLVEIQVPHIPVFDLMTQTVPPTLDGFTKNYIKISYAEAGSSSRTKVHGTGSYNSEVSPSYVVTANAVVPTAYEICVETFTGNPSGSGYMFLASPADVDLSVEQILRGIVNTKQVSLTVTGANWTTTRAVGLWYLTTDGTYRFKFNIQGSLSGAVNSEVLTISNVIFKQSFLQSVSVAETVSPGVYVNGFAQDAGGTVAEINLANTGTGFQNLSISGDVELKQIPSY